MTRIEKPEKFQKFQPFFQEIASDWQEFKRSGESGKRILERFSQTNIDQGITTKKSDDFFDEFILAHNSGNKEDILGQGSTMCQF